MNKSRQDLSGKIFGRLTVRERVANSPNGHTRWLCQCKCGNITTVFGNNLRREQTKSCGCIQQEVTSNRSRKHGHTVPQSKEYKAWCDMIQRCTNPNNSAYKRYGGRGIQVCDQWRNSFEVFLEDMNNAPTSEYSLDRINSNGNYQPSNCRWATCQEQNSNRSNNIIIDGKTLAEVCRIRGLPYATIRARIQHYNWSIDKALDTPIEQFVSRGADDLLTIINELFPHQKILKEHHIGERLCLDYFLPHLMIAFEYQGEQHYRFIKHFHKDGKGFLDAQKRDLRKDDLCDEQGITLICVAYNEEMSKELVLSKLEKALDA